MDLHCEAPPCIPNPPEAVSSPVAFVHNITVSIVWTRIRK